MEGEPGEDRGLRGSVVPLHVGGRISFGVAQPLRLLECLAELSAQGVHPVKDEVRGAVHDPEHPPDGVPGE